MVSSLDQESTDLGSISRWAQPIFCSFIISNFLFCEMLELSFQGKFLCKPERNWSTTAIAPTVITAVFDVLDHHVGTNVVNQILLATKPIKPSSKPQQVHVLEYTKDEC